MSAARRKTLRFARHWLILKRNRRPPRCDQRLKRAKKGTISRTAAAGSFWQDSRRQNSPRRSRSFRRGTSSHGAKGTVQDHPSRASRVTFITLRRGSRRAWRWSSSVSAAIRRWAVSGQSGLQLAHFSLHSPLVMVCVPLRLTSELWQSPERPHAMTASASDHGSAGALL